MSPIPAFAAMSYSVRSPEPAAPIQGTSGQPGAAFAVPAVNPTKALPATATAHAAALARRNIKPPTRPAKTMYMRDLSPHRSHALQINHKIHDQRLLRLRVVWSARDFAERRPTHRLDPGRGVDGSFLRAGRLLRDEPRAAANGSRTRQQCHRSAV